MTLGTLIENHEVVDLIDIRGKKEFSAMHIPGARSIPFAELARPKVFQRPHPSEQPVYIVSDDLAKATLATGILRASGHANATVVDGGMKTWIAHGLPVLDRQRSLGFSNGLRIAAGILVIVAGVAFATSNSVLGILTLLSAAALFFKAAFPTKPTPATAV